MIVAATIATSADVSTTTPSVPEDRDDGQAFVATLADAKSGKRDQGPRFADGLNGPGPKYRRETIAQGRDQSALMAASGIVARQLNARFPVSGLEAGSPDSNLDREAIFDDREPGQATAERAVARAGNKFRKGSKVEPGGLRDGVAADAAQILSAAMVAIAYAPAMIAPSTIPVSPASADFAGRPNSLAATAGRPKLSLDDMPAEQEAEPGYPKLSLAVSVTHQATHFSPIKAGFKREGQGDAPDTMEHDAAQVAPGAHKRLREEPTIHSTMLRYDEPRSAVTAALSDTVHLQGMAATATPIGRQIFNSILNEVTVSMEVAPPPAASTSTRWEPSALALRTLSLELTPEVLGPLTLVLSRSGGALRIHLEAERAGTAELVEQGREELTSRLAGAGYAIEELRIGSVPNSAPASPFAEPPSQGASPMISGMLDGSESRRGNSHQSAGQHVRKGGGERERGAEQHQLPTALNQVGAAVPWPRLPGSRAFRPV